EKNGRSFLGRFDDELMDTPPRADVYATARLVEDDDARTNKYPFRHQDFLLVAAGVVQYGAVHRVGLNLEVGDELSGASALKAFGEEADRKPALKVRQGHVRACALGEHEALLSTIFRHKDKPALNRAAWTGTRVSFVANTNDPSRERICSENGARQ